MDIIDVLVFIGTHTIIILATSVGISLPIHYPVLSVTVN